MGIIMKWNNSVISIITTDKNMINKYICVSCNMCHYHMSDNKIPLCTIMA